MTIWGNHSATQYPDFFNAKIAGKSVCDMISDRAWLENTFIETVQKRGAAVIAARGASSAASAANAVVDAVYALTHDTPSDQTFSMCVASDGEYGIDSGLIFSYPCRLEKGVLKVVESIEHNTFGQEKLKITHDELRHEYDLVKSMGLLN